MAIIVQKYGGSSVADVAKIGKVADKVAATRKQGHDVVVVVSAMGKTTDQLLALAKSAAASDVSPGAEPPRRELDMLLSTGERVSMSLLSIALFARGMDAISFTGSQSGIITNDRHFDARIIEVRPHRIEDELARGRIVIVAGYQGMSYRREITTLGRGGSDTTAVALAAALGAERCEIYSDVDGVYSADPRVVEGAQHLPELDAATLQEMAECGAKVICSQAVEWARRAKITIHARATGDGNGGRETVIRPESGARSCHVRAVVGESNVVVGEAKGARRAQDLVRAAARAGVALRDLSLGKSGASFLVPLLNVPDWGHAKERLAASAGGELRLAEPGALVSVVGDGLSSTSEPLTRFLEALSSCDAPVEWLFAGPLRISAIVAQERRADAERALFAALLAQR